MFLPKIVFAVFTCATVTNRIFVASQNEGGSESEEKTTSTPKDHYTFVALIDIVFVDNQKRTCTGTIIHDNVVITAAHCFKPCEDFPEPELTSSFVVLGTKKMYSTGYENYLPIERVLTHPKFKGWKADIALVYTFAGMTTDKPGSIIPIVAESTLTPVDSNVTILSWGGCNERGGGRLNSDYPESRTKAPRRSRKRICTSSEEDNDSCEPSTRSPLRAGISKEEFASPHRIGGVKSDSSQMEAIDSFTSPTTPKSDENDQKSKGPIEPRTSGRPKWTLGEVDLTTKFNSRYLSDDDREIKIHKKGARTKHNFTPKHRYKKAYRASNSLEDKKTKYAADIGNVTNQVIKGTKNALQSYFSNWRRTLDAKENKLTVETFGFVNVQTCKKMVEKALPSIFSISNTNEVVCYAAEEHYLSDDDSGAPAIRQGHLVAVTLGGVDCEGDHVAIGIKMNCVCSWIAENLPDDKIDLKCCNDCCNGEEQSKHKKTTPNAKRKANMFTNT